MPEIGREIRGPAGARRGALSLQFTGIAELTRALAPGGEAARRVEQAGLQAMHENSEKLLLEAQKQVPHKEGTLEASGTAKVAVGVAVEGGPADAIIGVVGFNQPYALEQHERLDFHHPNDRKAKYLEDPLKANTAAFQANIEGHLRGALR